MIFYPACGYPMFHGVVCDLDVGTVSACSQNQRRGCCEVAILHAQCEPAVTSCYEWLLAIKVKKQVAIDLGG